MNLAYLQWTCTLYFTNFKRISLKNHYIIQIDTADLEHIVILALYTAWTPPITLVKYIDQFSTNIMDFVWKAICRATVYEIIVFHSIHRHVNMFVGHIWNTLRIEFVEFIFIISVFVLIVACRFMKYQIILWQMAGNGQSDPTMHFPHEISRMHGQWHKFLTNLLLASIISPIIIWHKLVTLVLLR